jgi:hypothetical protein
MRNKWFTAEILYDGVRVAGGFQWPCLSDRYDFTVEENGQETRYTLRGNISPLSGVYVWTILHDDAVIHQEVHKL